MRRTIKPFAVEIRSSGRRPKGHSPAWPQLANQPDVTWPSITSVAVPEPALLAELTVESYRDPRKPPPASFASAENLPPSSPKVVEAEAPAANSMGRILPDLNEASAAAEAQLGDDRPIKRVKRAKRPKPIPLGEEPAAGKRAVLPPPAIDTKAIAATLVLRSVKAWLTRDDFKRGQRWKARLPASVHRAKSRQHSS